MNSTQLDVFIETIISTYRDKKYLTYDDLIAIGIADKKSTLRHWKRKKTGPEYIRLSKNRVVYPLESLIIWIRELNKKTGESNG